MFIYLLNNNGKISVNNGKRHRLEEGETGDESSDENPSFLKLYTGCVLHVLQFIKSQNLTVWHCS